MEIPGPPGAMVPTGAKGPWWKRYFAPVRT